MKFNTAERILTLCGTVVEHIDSTGTMPSFARTGIDSAGFPDGEGKQEGFRSGTNDPKRHTPVVYACACRNSDFLQKNQGSSAAVSMS